MKILLAKRFQLSTGISGDAPRGQPFSIRPFDGVQNIRTVSAAADRNQDIPFRGKVLQLLDENAIKTFVVTPGENIGGVIGQTEDLQPLPCVVREVFTVQRAFSEIFAEMRTV